MKATPGPAAGQPAYARLTAACLAQMGITPDGWPPGPGVDADLGTIDS